MIKKLLLAFTFCVGVISVQAEEGVLRTDFLTGYNVGDAIEKGTYASGATAMLNQWSRSARVADSYGTNPLAVAALAYTDYISSGKDVAIGLASQNEGEARVSTYTVAGNGSSYLSPSTFYMAFMLSVADLTSTKRADIFSFVEDHIGQNFRQQIFVTSSGGVGSGKYKLGISTDNGTTYVQDNDVVHSVGDVNLIVLKITFDGNDPMANGAISVFVNPVKSEVEPTLPQNLSFSTANGNTLKLKNIRGIAIRQCTGLTGTIGGFVLTDSWDKLWSNMGTSIENVDSDREVASVSYYTLSGLEVSELSDNNVYIQKTSYTNGDIETTKIVAKN